VSRQSWRDSKRDQRYSPLDKADYDIPTPTIQGQPTNSLDRSTESLIEDSSSTKKQSYWKGFKGPETPKKVCETGIWAVFRHLALFHIPPIGITLALLGLYISKIRWGDLTEEQLNFLQFAAKAHEILILVSLTDILLQRICYSLLHEDEGVPLGLLSSPFYLGSPLQYLFSWEFWAGFVQPGVKPKMARSWITGTVIIVTILLSIAAAPLSAIVMIPRQGWWQVYPVMRDQWRYTVYFKTGIYPTDLGKDQTDLYLLKHKPNDSVVDDPLLLLVPTLWDIPLAVTADTPQISNITYTNNPRIINGNRVISLIQARPDAESQVAVATTPMDTLATSVIGSWNVASRGQEPKDLLIRWQRKSLDSPAPKKWKQPLVSVDCAWNRTSGSEASFSFSPTMSSREVTLTFEENPDFEDLVTKARKMPKNEFPKIRHRFLSTTNEAGSLVSADFLFLEEIPKYFGNGTLDDSVIGSGSETNVGFHLCRVYARWAEVDMWVDRPISNVVQSQLDHPLLNVNNLLGDSAEEYEPIKMRKEWLEVVGQRRNQTGEIKDSEQDSLWDKTVDLANMLRSADEYSTAEENGSFLQNALGVHLADILSRMGPELYDRKGIRPNDAHDGKPPGPDDPIIQHTFFLGGFGYSIDSSATIPLALSILLLHVAIVVIHAVIVIFARHRWLSSCWNSFGEVLVLALRSEKHDLGNVGGGVDSSQTWSTSAVVRVVGEDRRLEMTLKKRGGGGGLVQGEGYTGEEGGIGDYPRVEPGVRYR
jgi:hypothetical protein